MAPSTVPKSDFHMRWCKHILYGEYDHVPVKDMLWNLIDGCVQTAWSSSSAPERTYPLPTLPTPTHD